MAYGEKLFDFTFASAASISSEVAEVKGYKYATVYVPTFSNLGAATAGLQIQGNTTATTASFKTVKAMGAYSAGSGILDWTTPDGGGNFTTEIPIYGQSWIRLKLTTAATSGLDGFTVRAWND